MKPRYIHKLAKAFLRGEMIPLFAVKAFNRAIDKEADLILEARRFRVKKYRATGSFYRGGDK